MGKAFIPQERGDLFLVKGSSYPVINSVGTVFRIMEATSVLDRRPNGEFIIYVFENSWVLEVALNVTLSTI